MLSIRSRALFFAVTPFVFVICMILGAIVGVLEQFHECRLIFRVRLQAGV